VLLLWAVCVTFILCPLTPSGKQVEWELAAEELERAQERLAALEAEKAALKGKVDGRTAGAAAAGSAASAGGTLEEMLRQDLALQREVNARLRQEVASCRYALTEAEEVWGDKVEALQEALAAAGQQVQELQVELAARPTGAQVRGQLWGINMRARDRIVVTAECKQSRGEVTQP
jgi:homeobox protein cut-like